MPFLEHDGIRFHYRDEGAGVPFFFQHGLGGDIHQPAGLFRPPTGVRFLAFDSRAHGETRPCGAPEKIGIASFADDLAALMDRLDLDRAVIGGISMGAAVALNFVLRYPRRTLGLVLARPAWLDRPLPPALEAYPRIARLIRTHGAARGKEIFLQSSDYQETLRLSPDNAESLAAQFDSPRAEEAVIRLERIPLDAPCRDRSAWAAIRTPVLVLANRQDTVHPFEYGKALAEEIPEAEFHELVPKSVSQDEHAAGMQSLLSEFLIRHYLTETQARC